MRKKGGIRDVCSWDGRGFGTIVILPLCHSTSLSLHYKPFALSGALFQKSPVLSNLFLSPLRLFFILSSELTYILHCYLNSCVLVSFPFGQLAKYIVFSSHFFQPIVSDVVFALRITR